MKIKKLIETPEGTYTFEGDISQAEHDFIVEAGLNYLLKMGVIPFKVSQKKEDPASFIAPDTEPSPQ